MSSSFKSHSQGSSRLFFLKASALPEIYHIRPVTDLYDKKEAFNFRIVNFLHVDSNNIHIYIPSKPTILPARAIILHFSSL